MIVCYKYHLEDDNIYQLDDCTMSKPQLPHNIIMKLISGDESQYMIRPPNKGLFTLEDELISPMYNGDLELPNVTWGYTNSGSGLICIDDLDELEIIVFPNARNIIHSIYYDYLNGRHDKTIEMIQVTYSNMRTETVIDHYD